MDERIIITQTVSTKNYCKLEHTMCEFANDRGYCVKTGCSKRIIINDKPVVNHNLVEVVRCKDCKYRDPEDHKCDCGHDIVWELPREDDWFCADGERKEE